MDAAFAYPYCPATYPVSSASPTILSFDSAIPRIRNDTLAYLAVTVAAFAAVPTVFWLRVQRLKDRERRRNRAMIDNVKTKRGASRVSGLTSPRVFDTDKAPSCSLAPTSLKVNFADEHKVAPSLDETKEKKKRSKDRRRRGRDREPSQNVRNKQSLPSCLLALDPPCDPPATDYTPRAPEQPHFSRIPDEPRAPSPRPSSMPSIASPTPVSLISTSFHTTSISSPQAPSETSSQPGQSRSASASPTTAPLTPPPLPVSVSLPSLVNVKSHESDMWVPQISTIPHDDPAWDWDGQSSTYSAGSPSRAPSSSGSYHHHRHHTPASTQPRAANKAAATILSPVSPVVSALPPAPSLVFPSLNTHPPPGASLVTQIASLKGALEASRTREEKHCRDAERWSKEYDLIKWRWNEAADMWHRREAELQAQIHHLVLELQTLTHAMQTASLPPAMASFMPPPSQASFPLAMPFPSNPSHHGSPFDMTLANNSPDTVNECLAEAILKRPRSIRPIKDSSTCGATHCGSEEPASPVENVLVPQQQTLRDEEAVIEFEFPTLMERHINSSRDCQPISSADEIEIFN